MAAYLIASAEVTDPDAYAEYTRQTPRTIEQYGGKWLVRGGTVEPLEGDWHPQRIVIVEFPSMEQARAWYDSPEYQALRPLRHQYAKTEIFTIVDGIA